MAGKTSRTGRVDWPKQSLGLNQNHKGVEEQSVSPENFLLAKDRKKRVAAFQITESYFSQPCCQ